MLEYVLKRTERKSIAISFSKDGLEVRAPLSVSIKDIERLIASEEEYILKRLAEVKKQADQRKKFSLDYGCKILYRGKEYPITAREGNLIGFDAKEFCMPPGLPVQAIKRVCVETYRGLARKHLVARTLAFAEVMGVKPGRIMITGAKTRWGSCSARGNVNYSWRLVMAEERVIDYVVVHELAHLIVMNHSDRFWAIVAAIMPDYPQRKAQLRELQKRLDKENWEE